MPKAKKKDKDIIIKILSESFNKNPSVLSVVKNDRKVLTRIKYLIDYSYKLSVLRKGVFISSDKSGAALCYINKTKGDMLLEIAYQIKLIFKAIGLKQLFKVLKREKYIKNIRPQNCEYIVFWFLGVIPTKRNGIAAKELRNEIFAIADIKNLPIILETSERKNMITYQRLGFKIYHEWDVDNITLWFMKREPSMQKYSIATAI